MPVVISYSGVAMLANLGVPQPLLDSLEKKGFQIEILPEGVRINGLGGPHVFSVSSTSVSMTAKKKAPTAYAHSLLNALSAFCQQVLESGEKSAVKGAHPNIDAAPAGEAAQPAPGGSPQPEAPILAGSDDAALIAQIKQSYPLTEQQIPVATKLPLPEARHLYQPVLGTDKSSKYFLVGRTEKVLLAARYQGGSLSLRVEGFPDADTKKRLLALGFNQGTKHLSVHLSGVSSTDVGQRAVGAALSCLSGQLLTPLPDVKLIQNKGA